MGCPACPTIGWFGGLAGSYLFGIQAPSQPGAKFFSASVTASLMSVTVIALKVFFDFSLCNGGQFNLNSVARVGAITFILGVIYSIGVNYILNRYVFPPTKRNTEPQDLDQQPECCGCKKTSH